MYEHHLYRVGEKLLPAIAYGDSAGLPFENKREPPQQTGSVRGLRHIDNPYLGSHEKGTWSDDTHLSIAVAKSLLDAGGFSLENQAAWHVKALNHVEGDQSDDDLIPPVVTTERENGWGASTTESVKKLRAGVSPQESGAENGAGNGVLMKLAPLVYWQVARMVPEEEANEQVIALTQMTHRAAEAVVASLVHRDILERLLSDPERSELYYSSLIGKAYRTAQAAERKYDYLGVVSDHIGRLVTALSQTGLQTEDIIKAAPGRGFYAPETLVMAYGSFKNDHDFPNSVYRAVELGGDADSVGSIVAAMSIFDGRKYIRPHDYNNIRYLDRLERISRELASEALRED